MYIFQYLHMHICFITRYAVALYASDLDTKINHFSCPISTYRDMLLSFWKPDYICRQIYDFRWKEECFLLHSVQQIEAHSYKHCQEWKKCWIEGDISEMYPEIRAVTCDNM